MTDTITYHKQRAFQRNLDMSEVSAKSLASKYDDVFAYLEEVDAPAQGRPENDALWFYMSNHAMAEIAMALEDFEPLGDFQKHVENYHEMMQAKSLRMFYYLFMITAREARHCHTGHVPQSLRDKYPLAYQTHMKFSGFSPQKFSQWASSALTIGEWLEYIEAQYKASGCYGGSYGGKPWANITRVTKEFVQGKITMEMLLDTAFTLSHNCGPIFNKGMLFNSSGSQLIKLLDVQRSGQIPQLVAESGVKHVNSLHREYQSQIENLIPSFGGYVDWHLVEKLGAVNSYPSEKADQNSKFGEPVESAMDKKLAKMKAKVAKQKQDKEHKEFVATHFEIMPDTFVKKLERSSL